MTFAELMAEARDLMAGDDRRYEPSPSQVPGLRVAIGFLRSFAANSASWEADRTAAAVVCDALDHLLGPVRRVRPRSSPDTLER